MRLSLLLALLLAITSSVPTVLQATRSSDPAPTSSLRVMSFNIRYDNPGDREHAWPNRRARVVQTIRFHQTDLLGAQEAMEHQVTQLVQDLPEHKWIGVGRSDGKTQGEYAPIFYREDRLELLAHGTFWLSPTPEAVGSRGWDAALPRIATWGRFRDRAAGAEFLAINTHFDHVGEQARRESAKLLVQRAGALAGDTPVILLGDFNAEPDSEAYKSLAGAYRDARKLSAHGHFGPDGTFGTFVPRSEPARRIDYIFVSDGVQVIREATLADHWEGRHASDHWAVFAELVVGSVARGN